MDFAPSVAEDLLVACHRHCCICHKFAGTKMVIHHIFANADGGPGNFDNGIPLCFDCHSDVQHYNPRHPLGRKFTEPELRRQRDQWFQICRAAPWSRPSGRETDVLAETVTLDDSTLDAIRIEEPKTFERVAFTIAQQDRDTQRAWVQALEQRLGSSDEDTRWKAASVIQDLIVWEPALIPPALVERMSRDALFSVRTSAAICYYHLAAIEPASVPVFTLAKLAAYDEDWYVTTPATGAMLRLARNRPVVVDLLARGLGSHSRYAREHAAHALKRLADRDWDLVSDEVIKRMRRSADQTVKAAGEVLHTAQVAGWKGTHPDYYLF